MKTTKVVLSMVLLFQWFSIGNVGSYLKYEAKLSCPISSYLSDTVLVASNIPKIVEDFIPFMEQELLYEDSFAISKTELAYCLLAISLSEGSRQSYHGAVAFQSILVRKGNNAFGIKGNGLNLETKEYVNGRYISIIDGFASFKSFEESLKYISTMFAKNKRYKKALKAITGEAFLDELQKAGYATSPDWFYKFTTPTYRKIKANDKREKSFSWTVIYRPRYTKESN